jgi:hypothetical protein
MDPRGGPENSPEEFRNLTIYGNVVAVGGGGEAGEGEGDVVHVFEGADGIVDEVEWLSGIEFGQPVLRRVREEEGEGGREA